MTKALLSSWIFGSKFCFSCCWSGSIKFYISFTTWFLFFPFFSPKWSRGESLVRFVCFFSLLPRALTAAGTNRRGPSPFYSQRESSHAGLPTSTLWSHYTCIRASYEEEIWFQPLVSKWVVQVYFNQFDFGWKYKFMPALISNIYLGKICDLVKSSFYLLWYVLWLLAQCSTVLLEKLAVVQLRKTFPNFYVTGF